MGFSFRKSLGSNNGESGGKKENSKINDGKVQNSIEHKSLLNSILRNTRTIIVVQLVFCLLGLLYMNLVLLGIGLIALYFTMGTKKGRYGVYINSTVSFLNTGNKDKALKYLNKAKEIKNGTIVKELQLFADNIK